MPPHVVFELVKFLIYISVKLMELECEPFEKVSPYCHLTVVLIIKVSYVNKE